MSGPIPINPVHLGGGQVYDGGAQPDIWATLLQGLLQGGQYGIEGYRQQKQDSRSSAENEIRKQELALQQAGLKLKQEEERTKQGQIEHQRSIADAQGKGTLEFLKHYLPLAAQSGELSGMMGMGQQGQGQQPQQGLPWQVQGQIQGMPQTVAPAPQLAPPQPSPVPLGALQRQQTGEADDPFSVLAGVVKGMDPEAVVGMMDHLRPWISMLQGGGGAGGGAQAIQTGAGVTTFIPGRGFYDPKTGGYSPYVDRGLSEDQKQKDTLERQIQTERLEALKAYRADIAVRTQTQQFNTRVKDLRDRGRTLQQSLLTIHDAQFAKSEDDRKALQSSALANFVQAADQKAQLRIQMLQYFKDNVDGSLGGRLEIAVQKLRKGTYPERVLTGLTHHLQKLLAQTQSEYVKHRDGEIKRHPELGAWLPEPDEFFTSDSNPGVSTPNSGANPLPPPP